MKIVLSSYPTLAVSLACFSGRDPIFFLFLSCIFFFMTSLWWFFLESICCFRSAWRSTVSRLISSFSSLPEVVEQLCKLKKFKKYHYYNVTITKWNIRELQNLYQAVKNKSFQHSQIGTFPNWNTQNSLKVSSTTHWSRTESTLSCIIDSISSVSWCDSAMSSWSRSSKVWSVAEKV